MVRFWILLMVLAIIPVPLVEASLKEPDNTVVAYRINQSFAPLYRLENKSSIEDYDHLVFQSSGQTHWYWSIKAGQIQDKFQAEPKSIHAYRLGFRDVLLKKEQNDKTEITYQVETARETFLTGDRTDSLRSSLAVQSTLNSYTASHLTFSLGQGDGYNPITEAAEELQKQIAWGLTWKPRENRVINFGTGYDFFNRKPLNYVIVLEETNSKQNKWNLSGEMDGVKHEWTTLSVYYSVRSNQILQSQYGLTYDPQLGYPEDFSTRLYYNFNQNWQASLNANYQLTEKRLHDSEFELAKVSPDHKIRFAVYLDERRYFLYYQLLNSSSNE